MKVFVITGPASSGKTTVIRHLEKLGFPVMGVEERAQFILSRIK